MGNFRFTIKNRKTKRRWTCPKSITLSIEQPTLSIISKTKKKTRHLKEKIRKMTPQEKKRILESRGIIKENSSAPQELINTMITTLI